MKIQDIAEANRLVKKINNLEDHFDQVVIDNVIDEWLQAVVYVRFIDWEKYKMDVGCEINELKKQLENL